MKNCVYRFLNKEGEIIYIGKAKNLRQRINSHRHLPKECYDERVDIQYISFNTEDDMDLAERYFVPKVKPKYNTAYRYRKLDVDIEEFDKKEWLPYYAYEIDKYITNLTTHDYEIDKKQGLQYGDERFIKIKKEINTHINQLKYKIYDKTIINADTGEMFENMQEAADIYNLYLEDIYDIIEHGRFYKYEDPKHFNASLRLMYYDVFQEKYNANPSLFENKMQKNIRKVIHLKSDTIYSNIYETSCKLNISQQHILKSCIKAKKYNNDGKVDFDFAWYDDYKHMLIFTV